MTYARETKKGRGSKYGDGWSSSASGENPPPPHQEVAKNPLRLQARKPSVSPSYIGRRGRVAVATATSTPCCLVAGWLSLLCAPLQLRGVTETRARECQATRKRSGALTPSTAPGLLAGVIGQKKKTKATLSQCSSS